MIEGKKAIQQKYTFQRQEGIKALGTRENAAQREVKGTKYKVKVTRENRCGERSTREQKADCRESGEEEKAQRTSVCVCV